MNNDSKKIERLLIVLISALDMRRINPEDSPFLNRALTIFPWVRTITLPEVDLDPTLLTGVYPHEHGMWQVRLKSYQNRTFERRMIERIPDFITTTVQCLFHLFTGSFDLAAVPSWRRRRFEIYKTRFMQRNVKQFLSLNGLNTIFNIVGEGDCSYVFIKKLNELSSVLPRLCSFKYRLEFLEVHAIDTLEHWNLDNQNVISNSYREIDAFIKAVHNLCKEKDTTLILLSDHGQEPVRGTIDIIESLQRLGVPRGEYTYLIEAPKARFYFHTDNARERILVLLTSIEHGTVLSHKDMHDYNVNFEDRSYGEYYLILDPGYIFFPNDYYHPLGNIFLGLTDWQQRSRLSSPIYRGYHGYLPSYESEKGFMILLDDRYKTNVTEVEIIDFAPTVLGLLGYRKPEYMRGRCIFS